MIFNSLIDRNINNIILKFQDNSYLNRSFAETKQYVTKYLAYLPYAATLASSQRLADTSKVTITKTLANTMTVFNTIH